MFRVHMESGAQLMSANNGTKLWQCFGWASLLCVSAVVVLLGQPSNAGAETQEMAPPSCHMPDDATAASLMERWAEAIKSEHPDHIARLFLPDASMEGIASPVTRTNYDTVREYYLYYFQFSPQVRFEEQRREFGCNYLVNSGNYTWQLKNNATGRVTAVPARYRFVFEYDGSQWQIGEHIEATTRPDAYETAFVVPAPQASKSPIVTSSEGPAVAGFLKRAQTAPKGRAIAATVRILREHQAPSFLGKPQLQTVPPRPPANSATVRERRWELDVFQPAN